VKDKVKMSINVRTKTRGRGFGAQKIYSVMEMSD